MEKMEAVENRYGYMLNLIFRTLLTHRVAISISVCPTYFLLVLSQAIFLVNVFNCGLKLKTVSINCINY